MNRRELLKFSLLSPLLGLFKKKTRSGTRKVPDEEVSEAMNCSYPSPSVACKNCHLIKLCQEMWDKFSVELTPTTGTSSEGRFFYLKLRDGHPLEGNKEVEKYLDDVTTYLHNTYPVEELLNDPQLCPIDTERVKIVRIFRS